MSVHETHLEGASLDSWQEIAEEQVDRAEQLFLRVARQGSNISSTAERPWSLLLQMLKPHGSEIHVVHHDFSATKLVETEHGFEEARTRLSKQFFLSPERHTIFANTVSLDVEAEVNHHVWERMQVIDASQFEVDPIIARLKAQSSTLKRRRFNEVPEYVAAEPMLQCAEAGELVALLQSALDIQLRERPLPDESAA